MICALPGATCPHPPGSPPTATDEARRSRRGQLRERGWRGPAAVFLASAALSAAATVPPAAAQAIVNGTTVSVPGTRASPWNVGGALTVGSSAAGTLNIGEAGQVNSTSGTLGQSAAGTGTVTASGAGAQWSATGAVTVGASGTGTLNISSGAKVNNSGGTLAQSAGSRGTAIVDGAGSQWNNRVSGSGGVTIASGGTADLTVRNGGQVLGGTGLIGTGSAATGTVTITDAGSAWSMTGGLTVGLSGQAGLNILNGAEVKSSGASMAATATGRSTVTVSGAGSTWNAGTSALIIANAGTGTLTLANGGSILSGLASLGSAPGSNGTATVSGAGTNWAAGTLQVGTQGTGTMTISDGAVVTSQIDDKGNSGRIGEFAGSTGVVTLTSGGAWTQDGRLKIGDAGTGTLTIGAGSRVTSTSGSLALSASGSATVNVDGAGAIWDMGSGDLIVGDAGTGALNASNGGSIRSGLASIGAEVGSQGTAGLTGAGSSWSAGALGVGIRGSGALSVAAGAQVTSQADAAGVSGRIGEAAGSTGVVTLTSGGTWTQDGRLKIGDAGTGTLNIGAAAGAVAGTRGQVSASQIALGAGGRIVFNHTDLTGNYVFGTPMTGSGAVLHENGFTTFTGTHGYSGTTTLTGGTLAVDGTLASSPFVVSESGLLIGNGTLGGLAVASGGKVAPGRSIGTLNVAGNASFAAGSTYEVEIDPAGQGDRIAATGAVTLAGGTVLLRPEPGTYGGRKYTIISADGGVTGRFDALDAPVFAFLDSSLDYTAQTVDFILKPTRTIDSIGETPNQAATARSVASLGAGNAVYEAVLFSATEEAGLAALDSLSGEVHASATTAALDDARWVREAVLDRLRWTPCEDGTGAPSAGCVWGQGIGAWGEATGDGNAAAMATSTGGFILGAEATQGHARLGLAGGYTQVNFDIDDRSASGETASVFGVAYGGASLGAVNLRAGVSGGWRSIETERDVSLAGLADRNGADYGGSTVQGFAEAGYEMELRGATIEPIAGVSLVRVATDSFTEDGGAAALEGDEMSQLVAATTLAVRGSATLSMLGAAHGPVVRGLIGWVHAFGDTPEADLAFASGSEGYTVFGLPVAEDALALQAAFDWQVADSFTAGLGYNGQIATDAQSHAIKANLSFAF